MSTAGVVIVSVVVLGVIAVTAYGVVLATGHMLDGVGGAPGATPPAPANSNDESWWSHLIGSGEKH